MSSRKRRSTSAKFSENKSTGLAVVGIRVAGGDQQCPVADHLDKAVPHPLGRPRIGDAASQPLGYLELALDLRQHQQ